jgi:hypothetical protein
MSIVCVFAVHSFFRSPRVCSADWPLHPMMICRGSSQQLARTRIEIVMPTNPMSLLRYELEPGIGIAAIIHCEPHADSIIPAQAALLSVGK